MIKQFTIPLVIAGTLLAGSSVQASNLVIDNFSDSGVAGNLGCTFLGYGQCVFRQTPGYPNDTQSGLSGVVGGSRQLSISGTTGQQSNFGIVAGGSGVASLANATGVASVSTLIYNAGGAGLNINENAFGGFKSFDLVIPSADLGLDATLTLTDGSGTFANLTLLNIGAGSNISTTASFDLDNPVFAALNFTDIDSVRLDLFGDADLDASIDQIGFIMTPNIPGTTTPEPTTLLGLLAIGAYSFASRRRQK
jgi:hypothetical protein